MKPVLHTDVGLALGAIVVLGAGAAFVGFIKVVQFGRRTFDQAADVVFGQ
ncbi:MAG: hypothetical protein QOG87_408 [Actinomycetota bacterium]|jgi:hypothetical protein